MGKLLYYVKVALAEAEHLLHDSHSPREVVLGFGEDVLRAFATGTLSTVSEPPVGSPVATPDPRDAIIASQKAQLSAFSAAIDAQIARITAATTAAAPAPAPVATPPAPPQAKTE